MSELVVIKTFASPVEANIVKHKLLSCGIPAFIADENINTLNPLYSIATGGVKVMVPQDVVSQALELLQASEMEYQKEMICEACGYHLVEFGISRKDKRNFFAFCLSILFYVLPPYQKKVYRCDRCGYETDFIRE